MYHAAGGICRVVLLIVALIGMFEVKDAVLSQMGASSGSDPTEAYICDRLLQSLSVLSACSNEQMREDYHVVLTALAPDPKDRMLEPVAKRLGITRYTHPQDPFVQSRERRAMRLCAAMGPVDVSWAGEESTAQSP